MNKFVLLSLSALLIIAFVSLAPPAKAVAPAPGTIEKWKAEGVLKKNIEIWKNFKANGGCAPSQHSIFDKKSLAAAKSSGSVSAVTAKILVILVDFSDHEYTGQSFAATPADFDSILFSDKNPTGSLTDFYRENSYGNFVLIGQVTDWLRMPSSYDTYEGGVSGLGPSGRQLALDAVVAADAWGVNFAEFDANGDGWLDGLVIIHAGLGAEFGVFGIWSHKWTMPMGNTINRDGINILDYTMNPEEQPGSISPIGVICHEFGHFLELPDLYDIDYDPETSEGLGRWALMASGNYNGNSQTPAHFCAWSKARVGFLNLIEVVTNLDSVAIPAIEFTASAFQLINSVSVASGFGQYWVVENRQRMGFDVGLPASGLLIYHVDTLAAQNNIDVFRYFVGLEQADGKQDLEFTLSNSGDGGDPFPGSTVNREFHDQSTPNDALNITGERAKMGVWDISDSGPIMYADFDREWSRPYIVTDSIMFSDASPGGNGDGNLDPGETIQVFFTARNLMRLGYKAKATLTTSNPDITFTANDVSFAILFDDTPVNNDAAPISFTISNSVVSVLDSFFLTISCDSLFAGTPGNDDNYSRTFGFEIAVGTPKILIVDDDRGADYEQVIKDVLSTRKMPFKIWNKKVQNSPTSADLKKYPIVFWHTGADAPNVITAADITAMSDFMDNGYSLFLSATSGLRNIQAIDPDFLINYFGAEFNDTSISASNIRGVLGSELGDSSRYKVPPTPDFPPRPALRVASGGEGFLTYVFGTIEPSAGISYRGSHKSVIISFPVEAIVYQLSPLNFIWPVDTLINRVIDFFDPVSTGIFDNNDPFSQLPESFELNQNFPNPFNPSTTISYTIKSRGSIGSELYRTQLDIFNLLGRKVKTLVDKVQSPGSYTVEWQGDTDSGSKVASGIYFYRLILGPEMQTKKMMLLK
ncbi:MAG: M6 family metalloprotease domain-containing protein [candidate division Zixibacteria bacterium]|nr:M6 family metalloprotease domain-containing protein [candidate division Zixibacteria bacterium]